MPRFLTIPQEPLARFRLLSAAFAASIAFLNVVLFALHADVADTLRWPGAVAAALLGAWWIVGYRRGSLPTAGWLVDMTLVGFIATFSPMPLRAVGLFYAGIQFRALYGSRRDLVLLPLSYGIARLASITFGPPDPSFELVSLTSAIQLLALVVISITLHLFIEATQRKATVERALARSEERYRLVAGAMRDVVYDLHLATGVVEWTESMHSVFGYTPATLGTTLTWWMDRVHPEDREALIRAGRAFVANPDVAVATVRYRMRRNDETYAHVSGSMVLLCGPDGSPERVIGSIRDVTTEQQLEEQLRQSQKMEAVGQLAGGVAHDFNNLLTVIGGHVFMLEQKLPHTPLGEKHLDGISRAAERAASLTKQLLAFSRKQLLTPSVINVNAVVDDVIRMMRPVIGEHLRIVKRLDPTLEPVFADAGQLGQVLVNLALNARDAMPSGGTLYIETENTTLDARSDDAASAALPPGEYIRLTMRDTGTGMDAATLARAFEPFFTTKPHGKGTGLGLATVYGIVKQSFGDIQATSAPGAGATFTILLPVAPRPAERPAPSRSTVEFDGPRVPEGRSVLLVEDDDGVRAFAREVLARAGYVVRAARNGADALAQLAVGDFTADVVVTDVVMPEMGGRELVQQLRRRHPDLPVLFMSGYTDDSRMLGELGAADARLLEKPFTAEALETAVEEVSAAIGTVR